ncbi:HofP DNA utilization family protein, partial [Salmonella enterica]|uniref:HofP DNA utilization family protein n=1 Tax=Salmonella enterica TaxID=28901 RepID=UPI001118A42B
ILKDSQQKWRRVEEGQTLKQRWDIPTGVPLSDAVRIRIPDVGPDISQQSALVKTGAGNAPDLC